ncbi:MAG: hypothetical protein ACTSVU_06300 [Promethearchaeota archaeon]
MSEQQKHSELIEYESMQMFPILIFLISLLLAFFLLYFQSEKDNKGISPSFYYTLLSGFYYAIILTTKNLFQQFIQINRGQFILDESLLGLNDNANEFSKDNVSGFLLKFQNIVLKKNRDITQLSKKIGINNLIFTIGSPLAIITGMISITLLIKFLPTVYQITGIGSIILVIIIFHFEIIEKLKRTMEKRRTQVILAVISFNEYLDSHGLNLNSSAKTPSQVRCVELLELANFLKKYHHNYKKYLYSAIIHGSSYFILGILIEIIFQADVLLTLLGILIMLGTSVYVGILLGKYKTGKKIYNLTDILLEHYLIFY